MGISLINIALFFGIAFFVLLLPIYPIHQHGEKLKKQHKGCGYIQFKSKEQKEAALKLKQPILHNMKRETNRNSSVTKLTIICH